ncbi:MAG: hypothetical protein SFX73_14070 [Kofleriaceae bacterium]|nr:hypothetical protein [Kofleriaceae bacterium]
MSSSSSLGRWMVRNARAICAALHRSSDEAHQALARELAPRIGADLDRIDPLPPIPARNFNRRR